MGNVFTEFLWLWGLIVVTMVFWGFGYHWRVFDFLLYFGAMFFDLIQACCSAVWSFVERCGQKVGKLFASCYGTCLPQRSAPAEPDHQEWYTMPEPVVVRSYGANVNCIYNHADAVDVEWQAAQSVICEPMDDDGGVCCICLDEISKRDLGTADVVSSPCCLQKFHAECVGRWMLSCQQSSPLNCPYCRHSWLQ